MPPQGQTPISLPSAIEQARQDANLVVLEGFHAVKHALRFGAELTLIAIVDPQEAVELAARLAPDLIDVLRARAVVVARAELEAAAPHARTRVLGIARRPRVRVSAVLARRSRISAVLLEDPRDLGNLGAAVRVAAAADVAAVLTTGTADPWDPAAVRGSAGLHFALPVARIGGLDEIGSVAAGRPLIGLDPGGEPLVPSRLPDGVLLAFGSERTGLSESLLKRCDARLALPMRAGVSSLNLATSVAAVLYAWRLTQGWRGVGGRL